MRNKKAAVLFLGFIFDLLRDRSLPPPPPPLFRAESSSAFLQTYRASCCMTLPPIPPPGEAAGQRKRRLKYFRSWGGRGGPDHLQAKKK